MWYRETRRILEMTTLGNSSIDAHRILRGWNYSEMARQTGLDRKTIKRLCEGGGAQQRTLEVIAETMKITVSELTMWPPAGPIDEREPGVPRRIAMPVIGLDDVGSNVAAMSSREMFTIDEQTFRELLQVHSGETLDEWSPIRFVLVKLNETKWPLIGAGIIVDRESLIPAYHGTTVVAVDADGQKRIGQCYETGGAVFITPPGEEPRVLESRASVLAVVICTGIVHPANVIPPNTVKADPAATLQNFGNLTSRSKAGCDHGHRRGNG
jgi:transcriptional regulator with XRE-family HTH domain